MAREEDTRSCEIFGGRDPPTPSQRDRMASECPYVISSGDADGTCQDPPAVPLLALRAKLRSSRRPNPLTGSNRLDYFPHAARYRKPVEFFTHPRAAVHRSL